MHKYRGRGRRAGSAGRAVAAAEAAAVAVAETVAETVAVAAVAVRSVTAALNDLTSEAAWRGFIPRCKWQAPGWCVSGWGRVRWDARCGEAGGTSGRGGFVTRWRQVEAGLGERVVAGANEAEAQCVFVCVRACVCARLCVCLCDFSSCARRLYLARLSGTRMDAWPGGSCAAGACFTLTFLYFSAPVTGGWAIAPSAPLPVPPQRATATYSAAHGPPRDIPICCMICSYFLFITLHPHISQILLQNGTDSFAPAVPAVYI